MGVPLGRVAALIAALTISGCVAPGPDQGPNRAMYTYRGNQVVPQPGPPGVFEVFSRPGDGAPEFWCAAGIFAEDQLYTPQSARLYLLRPRGPSATRPGRTSVVFTVSPDAELLATAGALTQGYFTRVDTPGWSYRAIHARQVCRPVINLPD